MKTIIKKKTKDSLLLSWILAPFLILALVWIAFFDLFKNKRFGFYIKKLN